MNVIRFNMPWTGNFDAEIDALKGLKGACDEAWLGLWGYYTDAEHEEMEKRFAHAVERVKEAGMRPVFELGANLGHVPELDLEVTKNFRKMVGMNGEWMPGVFCPRCDELRKYQTKVLARYMKYQPYAMILDDDMRLEFRTGVGFGCFCDHCIALFNEKRGSSLTRAEIKEKFLTEPAFRKEYVDFDRDSLAYYAGYMAKEAVRLAPNSRVGFENCLLGGQTGGDHGHIWEALYKANGHPVISRAGAFYYRDVSPRDVLDKVLNISYQNSMMPDYVTTRRPEIENTDNACTGKSVRGTLMEAELDLALGCNGTSYHMLGQSHENVAFEKRYFKALAEERPYYDAIVEWGKDSTVAGLHPVIYRDAYLIPYMTAERYAKGITDADLYRWADVPKERGRELFQIGVPISYTDGGAFLLHSAMVPYLSDGQIEEILAQNVLTDGDALLALQERGFGKYLPVTAERFKGSIDEEYLPHPLTEGLAVGHSDGFVGNSFVKFLPKEGKNADVTPLARQDDATTCALVNTARGGKWGLVGVSLFNIYVNAEKRRFLLNLADELAGGFSARLLSPEQAVTVPRKNAKGECVGVYTHSITISDTEALVYEIKNPAKERFVMLTPNGKKKKLRFEKKGDRYLVYAPSLPAYRSTLILCK